MKYLSKILIVSVCAFAAMSCQNERKETLLCIDDSDCRQNGSTDKCEAVSGLCVPYYENPEHPDGRSQFEGNGKGVGGIRGAFDCAVNWDADLKPLSRETQVFRTARKQGLATVFLTSPRPLDTCGDEQLRSQSGMNRVQLLEGLKTGCTIRLRERPRRDRGGIGLTGQTVEISFSQFSESPDVPVAAFRIDVRPSQIANLNELTMGQTISVSPSKFENGSLTEIGNVTARYFELCDDDNFSMEPGGTNNELVTSSLRRRFLGSDGELVLSDYTPAFQDESGATVAGRLRGYFDFQLVETKNKNSKNAGQLCEIPTDCDDANGCLDNEVITPACYASECLPFLRPAEGTEGMGVCGGRCRDAQDCGYHPEDNPSAYCLKLPGKNADDGQCIQICSTVLMTDVCSEGTVCRPGTDFQSEFGGEGGPARCIDRCVASASHELPSDCAQSMNRPDGGTTSPADGGTMMPPADAGTMMPPADAGTMMPPADAGTMMPPADAGTMMPPADAGTMMPPADAGTMSSSPLGTRCDANTPCPTGWQCAVQPMTSVNVNTVGYCSKPCASDSECTMDYSGPGMPTCAPPARFIAPNGTTMLRTRTCGILCGSGLLPAGIPANMCPGQMQCSDIVDNANPTQFMMPTLDSINDYCTE